ncbi:MAG: glycoside hydrolase family 2 protein [Anaerolineae bacterium]
MVKATEAPPSRAWLDLSGPWQVAFAPGDEGTGLRWPAGNWPEGKWEEVQVPALWSATHPDAQGVAFYRRVFNVPLEWAHRALSLRFEGVSYRADVWLNGTRLGSHEGAYTPFAFDVSHAIRVGSGNELILRVASLSRTEPVDGMVLIHSPASKQTWFYTQGGIWGAVSLEARPLLACHAALIEPDPQREMVCVELAIQNDHPGNQPLNLTLSIARADGSLAAEQASCVVALPGRMNLSYRIPLPRPILWGCETPHLYSLHVGINPDGRTPDWCSVPFGMRDFTVRDGQFLLNGEAITLRGLLLQPNYPITDMAPPTREMMVREITLAKEAGFNLLRTHIRPAPPGYLDLTDQMGMLVYAESCLAWIKDSPRLLDHGRRELQAMIERDRNHPSVVFWGIHNENRAASTLTSDALIRHVRALDPTRVLVDNSGGTMAIDQDFGWVDRATVVPSWSSERQRIQDLHIYVGAPISSPVYEWMRTLGIPDLQVDVSAHDFGAKEILDEWNHELRSYRERVFVSELGVGGLADLDAVVAGFDGHEHLPDAREMAAFRDSLYAGFRARRLDELFGDVRTLVRQTQEAQAAGLTRQVEALLANPRVSGFIITQLNDVAWEFHAGVLDHWRNPKRVYHALKRLNRPHCLILKSARQVVACGESVQVALTLVSRTSLTGSEHLVVTVRPPSGRADTVRQERAPRSTGVQELPVVELEVGAQAGTWCVAALLMDADGQVLAESSETVLVLEQPDLRQSAASVACLGSIPAALATTADTAKGEPRIRLVAQPAELGERTWVSLLDDVSDGDVAVIGPLRRDDGVALQLLRERGVDVRLHLGIGSWMGCFHWVRETGLLEGLPESPLPGEPFVDVLPWYVMSEHEGSVLAGSFRNTQTRFEPPAMLWYSDIEAVPLGRGTLLFCQYRLFDKAHTHALAGTMLRNLLRIAESYRKPRGGERGAL